MRRATCLLILCLLTAGPALAQTRPPALLAVDDAAGRSKPLGLSKVEVETRIFGFLAETRMTMTFTNPHDRQLEGMLHFPLPEGATVSGYALDIAGRMVDGVVVEKQKARVVFEKEVRKGADPGLVEWVKGNSFSTRVYPIPPRGSRTVAVEYVTDLAFRGGSAIYAMPLRFKEPLQSFSLRVEVSRASKLPRASWPGPGKLRFTARREGYFSEVTASNKKLVGQLEVTVPGADSQNVLVETDPRDEVHFCISEFPTMPASSRRDATRAPKRITVLWDASGSRGGQDHDRELGLLDAYLSRFKRESVQVELVVFRNAAETPKRFVVKRGDARQLLAAIHIIEYDGGTQMGAISPRPGRPVPDLYLLFSDGLSNFGEAEPSGFKAPVYSFSDAPDTNHPLLRHLASSTGGEYFNLNTLQDDQVIRRIGGAKYALLAAEVSDGKIEELFPRPGTPVHGRFTLTGKLRGGESATVRLKYGVGDQVLHDASYTIKRGEAVPGDLLARFWAQHKVQALLVSPKHNERALVALGKRYNLVTPGTSLMVLETLEQYLEHEIVPPRSWKELYVRYQQIMDERAAEKKREEQSKLEAILALWTARVEWWETKFNYPKNYRHREESEKKEREERPRGARPSAPMMERSMEAAEAPASMADEAPADARPSPSKAKKKDSGADAGPEPAIALAPWNPKTPYIAALKKAVPGRRFATYLEQKKIHGNAPAFFLDCADFFIKKRDKTLGLQVLSNIAEMDLDNPALLRILAHRLSQLERLALAAVLFEEVLRLRPEEPQSWRDLGLVLARQERYERALELLAHVVMNRWDRFSEIELLTLMELNTIIPRARKAGVKQIPLDKRLIKKLDLDIRIVLSWDADLTDIDLWVIEPSGEKAYYGHNRTHIGGLVSRDFTQGYGPEEYLLKKAMRGTYKVQTNFFGSSQQTLTGAVTLQLELFTNYGRKNQKRKTITLRLSEKKETFTVGELEF